MVWENRLDLRYYLVYGAGLLVVAIAFIPMACGLFRLSDCGRAGLVRSSIPG